MVCFDSTTLETQMNTRPSEHHHIPRTEQSLHMARICCAPEVSKLKKEDITSSQWGEVDAVRLEGLRALVIAGNELFGFGTHWIEMREAPPEPSN